LARAAAPSIRLTGPEGEELCLPASVYTLLARVVHELARGNAVRVVPVSAELTTQQAADLLNVSRPFLVKLLESGEIPFHHVGTHRRVRFDDVMAYRHRRSRARRAALAEMAREAQEMGLYE
jgi:excisionase family DNA binding protein